MSSTTTHQRCPACASPLARLADEPPWCPQCEWNLDERPVRQDKRADRVDREARRRAFALNGELQRELQGSVPARPVATRVRLTLRMASTALLLFDVALLVGGGYLLVDGHGMLRFLGVVLMLIGIECRIRFPRFKLKVGRLARGDAPSLFALVDTAGGSLGAPPIRDIYITSDWEAACGRSGLRRRPFLVLGLPLWGSLTPSGRLALLGHELGHLVNGDPTTAFTTQPAVTTFGRLATIFDPRNLFSSSGSVWQWVAAPFVYAIFWPLYLLFRTGHRALLRVARRDNQRAEAFADALGVRLAGTAGAVELVELLLFHRESRHAVRQAAIDGSAEPADWQKTVAAAVDAKRPSARTAEQISLRYDASPYASHPPSGLRHRLVASWPQTSAAIDEAQLPFAEADRELDRFYARIRRTLVNAPPR